MLQLSSAAIVVAELHTTRVPAMRSRRLPHRLQERWTFMRINKDLVAERALLVQTLRDYAVGKMADHDAALTASRDLRTNVMTEVCVPHQLWLPCALHL